ncbi:hypothetical protein M427DRAFT_397869 [Gonapodya prolifera JEL478]|uniref:Uncharacterized protein n=1 Tax=Gonapodya prolifera (strain JEL478) TaxID=1344416 RepID=A0A139A7P8_GONPJ|nr:hypothetical protein M427DRAFT_397869 [Gonapodya prolifera JEL478]|eukprot:KXS12465.1 hypothetical protein M427DRAFT_397869 [Gonapodya prolifera JEL478]
MTFDARLHLSLQRELHRVQRQRLLGQGSILDSSLSQALSNIKTTSLTINNNVSDNRDFSTFSTWSRDSNTVEAITQPLPRQSVRWASAFSYCQRVFKLLGDTKTIPSWKEQLKGLDAVLRDDAKSVQPNMTVGERQSLELFSTFAKIVASHRGP